jgi:hypothetical protein
MIERRRYRLLVTLHLMSIRRCPEYAPIAQRVVRPSFCLSLPNRM